MIKIDVSKFKSLDQSLKFYKQKRAKIGIDKELRARTEYVKPSVERRKEIRKAAYVQKTYKKS